MNPKDFNSAVDILSKQIATTVIKKNHDYGSGNILGCPVGPQTGIVVRLYDKIARLSNLINCKENPANEPLLDTWEDIAGYAVVGMLLEKGWFELPLKKNKK